MDKKELEELKEVVRNMSNEELDKVSGGHISPCGDPRCIYRNNHCECPDDDE